MKQNIEEVVTSRHWAQGWGITSCTELCQQPVSYASMDCFPSGAWWNHSTLYKINTDWKRQKVMF